MKNRIIFLENEYYHIYNRGVDKRIIFDDCFDIARFYQSMQEFNSIEPIGSIYENRNKEENNNRGCRTPTVGKLVEIVAYCLNSNHFHLILTPLVEGGISEFMKRLGGGYTNYYNLKDGRNGSLFQGKFKSVHVDSDSYLRFLSVYVNLNFKVHQKFQMINLSKKEDNMKSKFIFKSSWNEYMNTKIIKGGKGEENQLKNDMNGICQKEMILSHFDSVEDYKVFAEETLEGIKQKRYRDEDLLKSDFTI